LFARERRCSLLCEAKFTPARFTALPSVSFCFPVRHKPSAYPYPTFSDTPARGSSVQANGAAPRRGVWRRREFPSNEWRPNCVVDLNRIATADQSVDPNEILYGARILLDWHSHSA
jgi:hypothetical protein